MTDDDWWNTEPTYTDFQKGQISRDWPPYGDADISGRSEEWQRGWLDLDAQYKAALVRANVIHVEMRAVYEETRRKLLARQTRIDRWERIHKPSKRYLRVWDLILGRHDAEG